MKKIVLRFPGRPYPILVGRGLFSSLGVWCRRLGLGEKILIVTNKKVAGLFLGSVGASLRRADFDLARPYFFHHGDERDKSEKNLSSLWHHMAKEGLERTSTILALGGGVVGDVAGFAASTYMRGIALVQVPTTLLAQVDSAIGGKTAIDLPAAKNIVGTFYQPRLVVCDATVLKKMGMTGFGLRGLRNSFAEVIKYGMIQDRHLFELLEAKSREFFERAPRSPLVSKELSFLETLVARSVKVKAEVVQTDERETRGKRMILNYGHTFGHAFEVTSDFRLPHGEAVAMGMVCAARLARRQRLFSAKDEIRQNQLIEGVGLPVRIPKSLGSKEVIRHMLLDKKKRKGKLRFVLPVSIGRVKIVEDLPFPEIESVLTELKE